MPDQPVNGVTAGVDWACQDHAVGVVDAGGREIGRRTIEHSAAGLRDLVGLLRRYRVKEVAIERSDGPLVETLLAAGLCLVCSARLGAYLRGGSRRRALAVSEETARSGVVVVRTLLVGHGLAATGVAAD